MTNTINDIPGRMQAAVLHDTRDLRIDERPVPSPGRGEVLLQLAAAGICGSDVHYYNEGRIGNAVISQPLILGHEFSAFVVLAGEGVSGLSAGQLVAVDPSISCGSCEQCRLGHPNLCPDVRFCGTPPVDGIFSEYTVMPAENCFPLAEGFTPEAGAVLEPLGVALHAVRLAHLKPGDTAAVLGAGPIGLLAGAVARSAGAEAVFISEPLAYRREFAGRYCAHACLDPASQDPAAGIMALTGGRGVDVVFEAAGAGETPQQAVDMVRYGGKVVLAGIPQDDRLVLSASAARRKGLNILMVRRMAHTYPEAIRLVQEGRVNVSPLVTHRLPLAAVREGLEMVANYRDGVIKAVVTVS